VSVTRYFFCGIDSLHFGFYAGKYKIIHPQLQSCLDTSTTALPKILDTDVSTTDGFTVRAADSVDIEANLTIPAKAKLVITGETAITGDAITVDGGGEIDVLGDATLTVTAGDGDSGAAGDAVTVSVPVTVRTRGTLTVTGGTGQASGVGAGGAATVEKVSADYGSNITVKGGDGGEGVSHGDGGAATIGDGSDAEKKITFTATWATTNVTVTGGAAGETTGGTGGSAILYTSNTVKTDTYLATEGAVIDHVTINATAGTGASPGTIAINEEGKSITVTGGASA
jgi:hypothetical protein